MAACSGAPVDKRAPVAPSAPTIEVATPVDDPLNLDFERGDGPLPRGWQLGGGQEASSMFAAAIDHDAHHGARSLKIASTRDGGSFLPVIASTDAAPYRHKHVRLRGWIKTEGARGAGAALWLRGDGKDRAPHGFDNMQDHAVAGTTAWHEVVAETDIDDGADTLVFGVMLIGSGVAWFDALALEAVGREPPLPIVLAGRVVDHAHQPVAGAEVALCDRTGIDQHVTTDAAGAFAIHTTSGTWSLSAHRAPDVAAFLPPRLIAADTHDLELQLGATGGAVIHVRVTSTDPVPAGSFATIANVSNVEGDLWSVPIVDGAITAVVPEASAHFVSVSGALIGQLELAGGTDRVTGTLDVTVLGPPPAAVTAYLRDRATALVSPEASHGFADLAGVGKMVGNAHVVALGEATHGTREFFQLKHRVLEYLVAEKGFTVFAIEANQPECRAINDYIQHGTGDARAALAGIYFWTWNTEEVLAMIEWMRAWNLDPRHRHKLAFTGFDMQTPTVAYTTVAEYLRRVSPDEADALLAPIKIVAGVRGGAVQTSADVRAAVTAGVAAIATHLDDHQAAQIGRSSAEDFATARHDVTILQQWLRLSGTDGRAAATVRDEAMAANVAWLRAQYPPGTKLVLWAHNGHVARSPGWLGAHLTKAFGKDYVVFGFLFGEGSFQAMIGQPGAMRLREATLGPAPAHDLSAPFTRTGKPLLVVDLRALPAGPVARWFAGVHPMRELGSVFTDERAATSAVRADQLYDALIFVAKTTRAKPIEP